jgi:hypothetical protein
MPSKLFFFLRITVFEIIKSELTALSFCVQQSTMVVLPNTREVCKSVILDSNLTNLPPKTKKN